MSTNPAYAVAPFDHVKADIILRSSDNVDFRTFKLLLSLASPFFETLFNIPQPAEMSEHLTRDGLVVVPVSENKKTLDALLRFCYPPTLADNPKFGVLEDVIDVLEAARKYSLDTLEKAVCLTTLSNPEILAAEPLRCFAIARRSGLSRETQLAAEYTLSFPLIPPQFKEISWISASDLIALLAYHRKCGDAAYSLKTNLSWIKSHYGCKQGCSMFCGKAVCSCPKAPSPQKYQLFYGSLSPQWWEDFMEEMFEALRERPFRTTVESIVTKTVWHIKRCNCLNCSSSVSEGLRDLAELWVKTLNEVTSQIELDFH